MGFKLDAFILTSVLCLKRESESKPVVHIPQPGQEELNDALLPHGSRPVLLRAAPPLVHSAIGYLSAFAPLHLYKQG